MPKAFHLAGELKDVGLSNKIGRRVGRGIHKCVSHTSLCRKVQDDVVAFVRCRARKRCCVGNVRLLKAEP